MSINKKIMNAIKRRVNENRLRRGIRSILEASITRRFQKAVEALQKIKLDQQKLRKAFVAEKNPVKKEKLKKRYKRFMTDRYGSVMFKYKDRRKNG